jgi:hypothetical protein
MFVPFETLPARARVWIYQSEKKLGSTEKQIIEENIKEFINSWQSHGNELKGSGKVLYDHFLIISIDEEFSGASGCSIDKSVHFVKELEEKLNLSLLNRSNQSYLDGEAVQFFPIKDAKKVVTEGVLSKTTKTFNNNVATKEELESGWVIPAKESWLGKFFKSDN